MEQITIEDICYQREAFLAETLPPFAGVSPFHRRLALFLKEWYSLSPLLTLNTSGSTGRPKTITVRKEQMLQSAAITCEFLELTAGMTALLCLPLEYIAGKMMVVRAIYGGLNLLVTEPSGYPLSDICRQTEFAAMVPLQVHNSLGREEERVRLSRIGRLIIGGGAVDSQLEEALRAFPNPIYSTYGMTETVSHIALRRINGKEASDRYTPLPGVGVTLSETGTLVINAPRISDRPVITNDIAEMGPDGTFRILGRSDNVINSGGIKIQIEAVEELLRPHIGTAYAVTSVPDPRLGEAMVLLVTSPSETSTVKDICARHLQRRQQPRHIFTVEKIPQTGNGKTDRAAAKKMATLLSLSSLAGRSAQ